MLHCAHELLTRYFNFVGDTSHLGKVYSSALGPVNAFPLERNGGTCYDGIIRNILTSQYGSAQLRSKLEPLMMSVPFVYSQSSICHQLAFLPSFLSFLLIVFTILRRCP